MMNAMKKLTVLLAMLLMAAANACASGVAPLPRGVHVACAYAHPGYEIAAYDGWGDESFGQYALVLKKGDDNILCIAEKAKEDAAYQLTIDNTNAVYDGEKIPSLMIDSGGDSLFYTYRDGESNSLHLHTIKQGGKWIEVDVTLYANEGNRYRSINSGVWDGALRYHHYDEDENGNILDSWEYEPVPVSEAFAARMLPQNFDINAYTADPAYGLSSEMLEGLGGKLVYDGETLVDLDVKRDALALAVRRENGMYGVRMARDYGGGYIINENNDIAGKVSFDAPHAGAKQVMLHIAGYGDCTLAHLGDGCWYLTSTYADEGVRYGMDAVSSYEYAEIGRNDGVVYGASPWGRIDLVDFNALPRTYTQALEGIDQSAYALVRNPNPADRLHLRVRPDRGAASLGKFYNRTPVYVLERGDTWTKVRVGSGLDGLTGYMMTKYLVFDEDEKVTLRCAFPQKQLTQDYLEDGAAMWQKPDRKADRHSGFENKSGDFIIGVVGDEWYIVMRADGAVGYVPQAYFWDGNG